MYNGFTILNGFSLYFHLLVLISFKLVQVSRLLWSQRRVFRAAALEVESVS